MVDENRWLIQLAEHDKARFFKVAYEELTPPEQVFLCVWELEAEVNNGGFDQYFSNTSGDYAPHVEAALTAIGAKRTQKIVRQAIETVGEGVLAEDQEHRQERLLALDEERKERLEKIDQLYFTYPDNVTKLLFAYVQKHKAQIAGA